MEKSPKPGGEPKCIKGAAAGAGRAGEGGREEGAGGRCGELSGEGGVDGGRTQRSGPPPLRALARARTHSLARPAVPGPGSAKPRLQNEITAAAGPRCRTAAAVRGPGRLARRGPRRPPRSVPRPGEPAGPPDRGGGAGAADGGRAPSPRRALSAAPSPAALAAPPRAPRVLFGSAAAVFSPPRPPRLALAAPRVVNWQRPRIPPDEGSCRAAPSFFKLCGRRRRRGRRGGGGKGAVGGEKASRGRGGGEAGLKNNNNNKKVFSSSLPPSRRSARGTGPGAGGRTREDPAECAARADAKRPK